MKKYIIKFNKQILESYLNVINIAKQQNIQLVFIEVKMASTRPTYLTLYSVTVKN